MARVLISPKPVDKNGARVPSVTFSVHEAGAWYTGVSGTYTVPDASLIPPAVDLFATLNATTSVQSVVADIDGNVAPFYVDQSPSQLVTVGLVDGKYHIEPIRHRVSSRGAKYAYLYEADGSTLNPRIKDDLASGCLRVSDQFDWASRLPPSEYTSGRAKGGAGGTVATAGTVDGGSILQLDAGRTVMSDLETKTDIYQWGVTGKLGSFSDDSIANAMDYLNSIGGGELDMVEGDHVFEFNVIRRDLKNILVRASGDAKLHQNPNNLSANSSLFQVYGNYEDVRFKNLKLLCRHDSATPSTGSNPPILFGAYQSQLTEDFNGRGARVTGCEIEGGSWAGVMIYGRQNGAINQKHYDVEANYNKVTNCSLGLFGYKNIFGIKFNHNEVSNMAQNAISFDTRAASDSNASLPIIGVEACHNDCTDYGRSEQGIGILAKGKVEHFNFSYNKVYSPLKAQAHTPPFNAGIFVGPAFGGAFGRNGRIEGNDVRDIHSSGANGYGIYVGENFIDIDVIRNHVDDVKTYTMFIGAGSSSSIQRNTFKNAGLNFAANAARGTAANPIKRLEWWMNEVEEASTGSIYHQWFEHVTRLYEGGTNVIPNLASGNPYTELAATGIGTRYSGLSNEVV